MHVHVKSEIFLFLAQVEGPAFEGGPIVDGGGLRRSRRTRKNC